LAWTKNILVVGGSSGIGRDTPLSQNPLASGEKRKASADRHPLKRIGTSQEIARLAAYLLSDNGDWITAQIISIDGGISSRRTLR